MKLIVQIPCYNEEETLARTVADIPREIEGVDEVEILIIDDGSTDRTLEVASEIPVDHIVRHKKNKGLGRAFRHGLDACLLAGADIIVNTDGDNQYCGADIPRLIKPVLDGEVDIVIGDRQLSKLKHLSYHRKFLQWLGSAVVRKFAGVQVPDAVSGFRAINREAALRLNIVSLFSYTIEMLIQAGKRQIAVTSVPIRTNPKTRESRLFNSVPRFIERSLTTMIRVYGMYQPLRAFFYIATLLVAIGLIPIIRFLYFYFAQDGAGHIQSLLLGGVILLMGFVTYLVGMVTDLISFNRQLIELTLEKIRRIELELHRERPKTGKQTENPPG
jgi:glycosyltransferase involved in cell wall biosynthesis